MTNWVKTNLLNFLTGYVLLTKLAEVPMPRGVESHYFVCVCVCVCVNERVCVHACVYHVMYMKVFLLFLLESCT